VVSPVNNYINNPIYTTPFVELQTSVRGGCRL